MARAAPPKADTPTRLTNAARRLFSARGYAATSTRAIAEAADCNVSLIRHYFGSKEGLLKASMLAGISSVRDELDALAVSPDPGVTRIERFVAFMVDHFERHRDIVRILEREIMNKEPMLSELRPLVAANIQKLAGILEEARAAGELAADMDAGMAAILLMGMIKYYFLAYPVTSKVIGPSTPRLRRSMTEQIARLFLHGASARPR